MKRLTELKTTKEQIQTNPQSATHLRPATFIFTFTPAPLKPKPSRGYGFSMYRLHSGDNTSSAEEPTSFVYRGANLDKKCGTCCDESASEGLTCANESGR
ncbi:hypothetical protein L596_001182 [Steinernema carpocapsae]|uniref:Uncharacterized protein n=1 Tax=Steinernema carpocapsae TaxID=34508 RepID=A0A4U8UKR1_STECR|nr:hypothetical protein L596_001182 [Steinernema carpocapsae]